MNPLSQFNEQSRQFKNPEAFPVPKLCNVWRFFLYTCTKAVLCHVRAGCGQINTRWERKALCSTKDALF